MASLRQIPLMVPKARAIVMSEANSGLPLKGDFERMARRRYQNPRPTRRGAWWTLLVWQDVLVNGKYTRKRKRMRLAPATMSEKEVRKIASEVLRPINQGLESIGAATSFAGYIETTYKPLVLPLMAMSTKQRYEGIIKNYLLPT